MKEIKLNLGSGANMLEGFINMDIRVDMPMVKLGKKFETFLDWDVYNGLPDFENDSISAVTISHLLAQIEEKAHMPFLREVYRVLKPKGIVRITHTDDDLPKKIKEKNNIPYRNKYFKPLCPIVGRTLVGKELKEAGFKVKNVTHETTFYKDKSLIQNWHRKPSLIFHIEGIK